MMNRIGRERGWPPMSRAQFDAGCAPEGHLLVGTPQDVASKIVAHHELFGHDRFLGHISVGVLPHEKAMRATELFATEVAPLVHGALPRAPTPWATVPMTTVPNDDSAQSSGEDRVSERPANDARR